MSHVLRLGLLPSLVVLTIGVAPAQEAPPRVDRSGDPLPPRALARLGTTRLRHGPWVTQLTFAPDGKRLASAGADGFIRVWDAATGAEVKHIDAHRDTVSGVAFFADGKRLASAGWDGMVRLWDATTGQKVKEWGEPGNRRPKPALALALTPDGRVLAVAFNSSVYLWNVTTTELPHRLNTVNTVWSLAFSPDGRFLALGNEGSKVSLREVSTGRESRSWKDRSLAPEPAVAFSPDGRQVALTSRGPPAVWDATTGELDRRMTTPRCQPVSVAFTPDGRQLAGAAADGCVWLWDAATGREVRAFPGRGRWVRSPLTQNALPSAPVAFSADGRRLAVATGSRIRIFETDGWREVAEGGHDGTIWAAGLSADGRTAATADADTARLWDTATGRELRQFNLEGSRALQFTADLKTLATGDSSLRLWDVATGRLLTEPRLRSTFKPERQVALGEFLSPDGRLVLCKSGIGLELQGRAAGQEDRLLRGPDADCLCAAFSSDGRLLATQDGTAIRLWDMKSGRYLARLGLVPRPTGALALAPDGELLAAVAGPPDWSDLAGPAPGRAPGRAQVVETATNRERGEFGPLPGGFHRAAFAPDGRLLATAGHDGCVRLWELASGQERAELAGHRGPVVAVAFAADGRTLISAGADATALVWDLRPSVPAPRDGVDLEQLWDDLISDRAAVGYQAVRLLADRPAQAVPLMERGLLTPPAAPGPRQLAAWVADLESDRPEARERASVALARAGAAAEQPLRDLLFFELPPETRKRALQVLQRIARERGLTRVREARAIEVLELVGNAEARGVLMRLARESSEAEAALKRLEWRGEAKDGSP